MLFALVLDTARQQQALHEETLARVSAIHHLSETLTTAKLESPDARSHGAILEALAVLSRDVHVGCCMPVGCIALDWFWRG